MHWPRPRRLARCGRRTGALLLLAAAAAPSSVGGCTFPEYEVEHVRLVPGGGQGGNGATASSEAGTPAHGGTNAGDGGTNAGDGGTNAGDGGTNAGDGASSGAAGAVNGGPLLFDDFEDGNDDKWFATSGDWQVVVSGSNHVYRIANLLDQSLFSIIGDLSWTDIAIEANVRILEWGGTSSSDLIGVFARFESPARHYYVALRSDGKLALRKKVDTNVTLGNPVSLGLALDTDYKVRLEVQGSELRAYLDGVLMLSTTDTDLSAGRVAIGSDNARAEFDDVTVTAL